MESVFHFDMGETMLASLRLEICQDIEVIEQQWIELGKRQAQFNFYQKPGWFKTYTQTISHPDGEVFYLLLYQEQELQDPILQGIIPLEYLVLKKYGLSLRTIQFPSHEYMDLLDCLIDPSIEVDALEQILTFLKQHKDYAWDVIFFNQVLEDSYCHRLFEKSNFRDSYSIEHTASSYIQCGASYEESVAHISSKFKRNINRLQRKAEKQGQLEYISYDCIANQDKEHFEHYFQQFLLVEHDSWKSELNTAILCHKESIEFFSNLCHNFAGKDHCVINLLKLDDEYIAVQFGIKENNRLNLIKIGFRQAHKDIGPGNIILKHTITQCVDEHIQTLSTVTAPPWAEKWKSASIPVYRHLIFNKNITGFLAKQAFFLLPTFKKLRAIWHDWRHKNKAHNFTPKGQQTNSGGHA